MPRSLLFVPGDRPERFGKAMASGADAVILDLEDSVSFERKAFAREAVVDALAAPRPVLVLVRVNPVGGAALEADLDALAAATASPPDAIVLPKAAGVRAIDAVDAMLASGGIAPAPPLLPIATETPAAIFRLGEYPERGARLFGLTWGAEDLPAAIGAATAREQDGRWTAPYELARSLTLFAAAASDVPAIDTVFPSFRDTDGLASMAKRAARDGFSGMLAIHPIQVAIINTAFTPDQAALQSAERILAAFASAAGQGAVELDGRMLDAPHLAAARRTLSRGLGPRPQRVQGRSP